MAVVQISLGSVAFNIILDERGAKGVAIIICKQEATSLGGVAHNAVLQIK